MTKRRKSTRTEAKARSALRSRATPNKVTPLTLPWNCKPTADGEREWWEELRWDLMEAFDEGNITREEAFWYITLMADMFESEDMRTPGHIVLARLCFFSKRVEA